MTKPDSDWIERLPVDRTLGEFSLWSANLLRIGDELTRIDSHADLLHIDVADGHFAPAFLLFPDLVAALRDASNVPIHVHLMVEPSILLTQIDQFAEAGADLISLHLEHAEVAERALDLLDQLGVAAGMVIRAGTPVAGIVAYLPRLRWVTLLGTEIGVKGQGLNDDAPARLRETRALIGAAGGERRIVLAADGGIREHTVPTLVDAGAETVVLGSLAFGADDLGERIRWLHALPTAS